MKRYVRQPYKHKTYHIIDIDMDIIVEETTRKEVFSYIDEYLENLQYDWFDPSDDAFHILYADGTYDDIDQNYDGHRIRKQNIVSMVYDNPGTSVVYGPYEINYYGVVTPSTVTDIDESNIELVGQS